MKKKEDALYRQLRWIELAIAGILLLALIVLGGRMIMELWEEAQQMGTVDLIYLILADAFLLVIGVEFVKMIIKPSAENILEVIMLTITRSLIMDHSSMAQTLLGVVAMLLLFFIRKYLFCEMSDGEEDGESIGFRKAIHLPRTKISIDIDKVGDDENGEDTPA